MSEKQETEKVNVIFGATGGIGAALCRTLSDRGSRLLLVARDAERLSALAREVDAPSMLLKSGSFDGFEQSLNLAKDEYGAITGVANCIGSLLLKPAHRTTDEEWDAVLAANLTSAFATVRAAGRSMRQTGGSVVLVSSAAALTGLPNHEGIAAAKAGVVGLTRSAAASYAGARIRFNAVAPGLVRTKMTHQLWSQEASAAASIAMHALGRLGEPEDVASMIAWLLDPANDWITGQVISIDGGLAHLRPRSRR